jgi:Tol biopolymer transport system component
MNADGSNSQVILNPLSTLNGGLDRPMWSPDGKKIVAVLLLLNTAPL